MYNQFGNMNDAQPKGFSWCQKSYYVATLTHSLNNSPIQL